MYLSTGTGAEQNFHVNFLYQHHLKSELKLGEINYSTFGTGMPVNVKVLKLFS
jgi:hypothetical protein